MPQYQTLDLINLKYLNLSIFTQIIPIVIIMLEKISLDIMTIYLQKLFILCSLDT